MGSEGLDLMERLQFAEALLERERREHAEVVSAMALDIENLRERLTLAEAKIAAAGAQEP